MAFGVVGIKAMLSSWGLARWLQKLNARKATDENYGTEPPTWGANCIYKEPQEGDKGSGAETRTQTWPQIQPESLQSDCGSLFAKPSYIRGT